MKHRTLAIWPWVLTIYTLEVVRRLATYCMGWNGLVELAKKNISMCSSFIYSFGLNKMPFFALFTFWSTWFEKAVAWNSFTFQTNLFIYLHRQSMYGNKRKKPTNILFIFEIIRFLLPPLEWFVWTVKTRCMSFLNKLSLLMTPVDGKEVIRYF